MIISTQSIINGRVGARSVEILRMLSHRRIVCDFIQRQEQLAVEWIQVHESKRPHLTTEQLESVVPSDDLDKIASACFLKRTQVDQLLDHALYHLTIMSSPCGMRPRLRSAAYLDDLLKTL